MRNRLFPAGLTVVLLLFTTPYASRATADPSWYTLVSPAASGVLVDARGLNAAGTIGGFAQAVDGRRHAFVSLDGVTPAWLATPGDADARALAVNDTGIVAGDAALAAGLRAVTWTVGAMTDLGTLGGPSSVATGINASGVVTGSADTLQTTVAFRYTPGTGMEPVGAPGIASFGYGINAAGTVVGQNYLSDGTAHAFVAPAGGPVQDPGGFGGPYAAATAINDSGLVVGWAMKPDFSGHAFKWTGGALVLLAELGTLGSSAEAVNETGSIVGYAFTATGAQHAVLWSPAGDVVDLNTLIDPSLGWTLTSAQGINASGQIVGYGTVAGQTRVFLLTPPQASSDTTAPTIHYASATPPVLWPPRHQLVPVRVTVEASDDSGEAPACEIAAVGSSEPDNGTGDGDTAGDIVRNGSLTLELRAERSGDGPGRVYTIGVVCSDASGNETQATVQVSVTGDSEDGTTADKAPKKKVRR